MATPVSPSCGRSLAVVMDGGDAAPPDCLTGDQTTRCTPSVKSAQALTEQQTYLSPLTLTLPILARVALVITASRKAARGTLPPLSLITVLESPWPLALLPFPVFPLKKLGYL